MASPEATSIQNITPEQLALSALHFRASYYTIVAGFVIYCYDIMLTLQDESSLLWSKGGRFIKTLYLTNRYLPFAGLLFITYTINPVRTTPISDNPLPVPGVRERLQGEYIIQVTDDISNRCKGTFILAQLCQAIEIVVATSIFVIRIYTIYNGYKFAQRLLVVVLVMSHIVFLTFVAFTCIAIMETMFYSPILNFCVATPGHLTGALYLTPIVLESFIVVMTLVHAVVFGRRQRTMGQTAAASILRTLYLDGCMYYLIICGLRVATISVFYFAPETLILLMPFFEYALTSTVTSRWFLSFRQTLVDTLSTQDDTGTSSIPFTGASISFGRRASDAEGRRTGTFLSSYAPRTSKNLRRDEIPEEIGISSSMAHELKALDSHPQTEDWHKDSR